MTKIGFFQFLMFLASQFLISMQSGPDSGSSYDKEAFQEIKRKQIIRGNYKDVASEQAGAIISNGRSIGYYGGLTNSSPLRLSIYYVASNTGFCYVAKTKYLIVDFLQPYEINTIKLWLWDRDPTISLRQFDIQIFILGPGMSSNQLVYDSSNTIGLATIKFSDTFVSQVYIYNRNGNQIDLQWLFIMKIQAFYSF